MPEPEAPHRLGAQEFARAAGITYRQLDFWTRGALIASTRDRVGSGYPRSYDPAEVPVARLMGQLVAAGLFNRDARLAHEYARRLHRDGRADVALSPTDRLIVTKVSAA